MSDREKCDDLWLFTNMSFALKDIENLITRISYMRGMPNDFGIESCLYDPMFEKSLTYLHEEICRNSDKVQEKLLGI